MRFKAWQFLSWFGPQPLVFMVEAVSAPPAVHLDVPNDDPRLIGALMAQVRLMLLMRRDSTRVARWNGNALSIDLLFGAV